MRRRVVSDPYIQVIQRLNQQGIRYIVVGMSGINYYGRNLRETFATMDYDLFLEPTLRNVERAVHILTSLDFTVGSTEGALRPGDLRRLVRGQKTLVATNPDGVMVELLLKISGYPFAELAKDAATFTIQGTPVRVGRLEKLLQSKKLAGRPKDRQFLQRYPMLRSRL